MSTELPIASTSALPGPTNAVAIAAEDSAAQTQTFMTMLTQLLDEGAVVVAAPSQPLKLVTGEGSEKLEESSGSELVVATSIDESLLSLLLPPPAVPTTAAPAKSNATGSLDSGRSAQLGVKELAAQLTANLAAQQFADQGSSPATPNTTGATISQAAQMLLPRTTPLALDTQAVEQSFDSLLGVADGIDGVHTQNSSPAAAAATKHISMLEARVGTPAWSDELAAKVSFLNERGLQSASLRLSPEHLGPMEIQISMQDDKAKVWFGAAHAETRAALEQALPRLREILQSQGLTLSDAGVFREPPREQARAYTSTRPDGSSMSGEPELREVIVTRKSGLLDAYA
jgi:flagellar hook-length control protein FliK